MSRIPRNRENQEVRDHRHREEGGDHNVKQKQLKNGPGTRSVPCQKKEAYWSQESRSHHNKGQQCLEENNDPYREKGRYKGHSQESRGHQHHYRGEQNCEEYNWKKGDLHRDIDRHQRMNPDQSYASSFTKAYHQESDYYRHERSPPSLGYMPHPHGWTVQELEYHETEQKSGILECNKCRYLCTGRACCQLVEVLLNMLILICGSVSYNSTGGYTGITSLGGIYYYHFGGAYSGFDGVDGETAKRLDTQFYQLKLPTVVATMAFGGALMGYSCLLVLIGILRLPWRFPMWLLVEFMLDVLIAFGYIPALYFYFRKLLDAYESQICKNRDELYSSKGYKGFSCSLHGADVAVGIFGCLAAVTFFLSAVLAIQAYRRVCLLKKKPVLMHVTP
uniref:MARVEL domain-containing protein 3 isoform X1 n=1 Tax=Geotrypetes seraphini TaxID=260995 RepID=A0A6P8QF40_GEOSA|nr:MARVEL domain-containing protein 3 isoform X1 [Geotrypetes seraphini]XP_033797671.1 MARVEL domain-containing protein 3 isoform X1 [Geotrypetes seraphini]XP_033797672.1 MARVEL domain-containing protein 3 isoform X1 [Geotrypetes seraphini]